MVFFVSLNFRCKRSYCHGIPVYKPPTLTQADPELSDFYFIIKVGHGSWRWGKRTGEMERAGISYEGFRNVYIQCVVWLLVLFIYFYSGQRNPLFSPFPSLPAISVL